MVNQVIAVAGPFFLFMAYYFKKRSIRDFHDAFLGEYFIDSTCDIIWRAVVFVQLPKCAITVAHLIL